MSKGLLAIVLVVNVAAFQSEMASESPRKREMSARLAAPLESQIRPDDEVIILRPVEKGPARIGRPSVQQVVNDIRRTADAVVVAEIVDVSAHLTPAHDWILTDLSLYTHEVLRRNEHLTFNEGQRKQEFSVAGGELIVSNALVKTEGTFSLKVGGLYLLCFAKGKGGVSFSTWAYPPLLIEGGRLSSKRSDFIKGYYDPLGGQAVSTIVRQMKKR